MQSYLKAALVLACFIVAAQCASLSDYDLTDPIRKQWNNFKTKHAKSYGDLEEENFRFGLFLDNLRKMAKHNAETGSFKLGINHMSDWTKDEVNKLNGLRLESGKSISKKVSLKEAGIMQGDEQPPESFSWLDTPGVVSAVKNQGSCGSCWAFATTGLVEGQEHLKNKTVVDLSEQQLVDCDREYDAGCGGGLMDKAIEYIAQVHGLEEETDYPYKSGNGDDSFKCRFVANKTFPTTRAIEKPLIIDATDEDYLRYALWKYGPIAIAMDASGDLFQSYKSGVYYNPECSPDNLNHGVLLVGYGANEAGEAYWIVKNSWSAHWGQEGFFWIARNKQGHCGITMMPTIFS